MSLWSHCFSQNMNRKLQGFLPCTVPHYSAEILTLFGSYFGRNDDFIDSFWNLLTFTGREVRQKWFSRKDKKKKMFGRRHLEFDYMILVKVVSPPSTMAMFFRQLKQQDMYLLLWSYFQQQNLCLPSLHVKYPQYACIHNWRLKPTILIKIFRLILWKFSHEVNWRLSESRLKPFWMIIRLKD